MGYLKKKVKKAFKDGRKQKKHMKNEFHAL